MTDIAVYIVADENLGSPDSMYRAFEILHREGYISKNDLVIYKNMVGFRNILAHEYINLDKKIVCDVMNGSLKDFERFIALVHRNFL